MALSTPSPPFPKIPTEIEAHILSFCDQATLAKCSTLSLAFLQLSSPLLYEDVVLLGFESLHKLLCARPNPSYQSHLQPYLALTQIKQLSLVVKEGDAPRKGRGQRHQEPIIFNKDRLPSSSSPLPLHSLSILLPIQPPMMLNRGFDHFLSLFDPTSFHLQGYGPPHGDYHGHLPDFDCYRLEWKRIKHFTFERARLLDAISFILSRSVEFSFDVTYDLSSFRVGSGVWKTSFQPIVRDATQTNLERATFGKAGFIVHGMEKIKVLVATEGGKMDALDRLREESERWARGDGWEKMRRNIEVVVISAST